MKHRNLYKIAVGSIMLVIFGLVGCMSHGQQVGTLERPLVVLPPGYPPSGMIRHRIPHQQINYIWALASNGDPKALAQIGDHALLNGEWELARKCYHDALAFDPKNERANLGMGEWLAMHDMFRDSLPFLVYAGRREDCSDQQMKMQADDVLAYVEEQMRRRGMPIPRDVYEPQLTAEGDKPQYVAPQASILDPSVKGLDPSPAIFRKRQDQTPVEAPVPEEKTPTQNNDAPARSPGPQSTVHFDNDSSYSRTMLPADNVNGVSAQARPAANAQAHVPSAQPFQMPQVPAPRHIAPRPAQVQPMLPSPQPELPARQVVQWNN